jgi:predicted FMN-binding regulatory protein PaiB
MMHTEMGDPNKADDAEIGVEEDFEEEFEAKLPEEIPEETVVLPETANSDNVGDVSVEINVEELVAEIEASQGDDAHKKNEIRKRLEDIQEQKQASQEIGDTFNIDLNEDD